MRSRGRARLYDGHPPRTSAKHWNENVPYCPEMGMGRPPPGRDTNPPPRSPGRVLDPMRAMERGDDEDRDEDPDDDVHLDDEDAFGSDSEPARGSRDRSDDRSNDRDPSLVGSPPGIRDGAHPHPRSPPSDPTRHLPLPRAFILAAARDQPRPSGPRVSLVASSPVEAARDAAAALEDGARPSWRRWTARRTVRIIRRYLRVRRVGSGGSRGRVGSVEFPRTRAGAAEVEEPRGAFGGGGGGGGGARVPSRCETPPRRRVDVGGTAATRVVEEETRAIGGWCRDPTPPAARRRRTRQKTRREAPPGVRRKEPGAIVAVRERVSRCASAAARRTVVIKKVPNVAPAEITWRRSVSTARARLARPPRRGGTFSDDGRVPSASRPTRQSDRTSGGTRRAVPGTEGGEEATRRRRDESDAEGGPAADDELAYPAASETTGERQNRRRTSTRTSMKRSRSPPRRKPRAGSPAAGRDETRVRTVGGGEDRGRFDWRRGSTVWGSLRRAGFARRIPGPAFGRGGADDGVS